MTDTQRMDWLTKHARSLYVELRVTASDGLIAAAPFDWPDVWDDALADESLRDAIDRAMHEEASRVA